ncbi:MAG TPA: copper-binding protein [Thermoanaerobaculia bacterium]|nr:copper-binding protein [Thermoanaerobaculia bacterium]
MKELLITALVLLAVACAKQTETSAPSTAAKEKTYPMTATIVSRDPAKNTVNLDNKEVPGEMAAMKMDYELRGAKVAELPADGTPVVVTVHDVNGSYYVTDVEVKR